MSSTTTTATDPGVGRGTVSQAIFLEKRQHLVNAWAKDLPAIAMRLDNLSNIPALEEPQDQSNKIAVNEYTEARKSEEIFINRGVDSLDESFRALVRERPNFRANLGSFIGALNFVALRKNGTKESAQAQIMRELSNVTWNPKEAFNNFKLKVLNKLSHAKSLEMTEQQLGLVPFYLIDAVRHKLGDTYHAIRKEFCDDITGRRLVNRYGLNKLEHGEVLSVEKVVQAILYCVESRESTAKQSAGSSSGPDSSKESAPVGFMQNSRSHPNPDSGNDKKKRKKVKKEKQTTNQPAPETKPTAPAAQTVSFSTEQFQQLMKQVGSQQQQSQGYSYQQRGFNYRGRGGYRGGRGGGGRGGYQNWNWQNGQAGAGNQTNQPNQGVNMALPSADANQSTGFYPMAGMVTVAILQSIQSVQGVHPTAYVLDSGAGINCFTHLTELLESKSGKAVTISTAAGEIKCDQWGYHKLFGWGVIVPSLPYNLVSFVGCEDHGFSISYDEMTKSFTLRHPEKGVVLKSTRKDNLCFLLPAESEVFAFSASPTKLQIFATA